MNGSAIRRFIKHTHWNDLELSFLLLRIRIDTLGHVVVTYISCHFGGGIVERHTRLFPWRRGGMVGQEDIFRVSMRFV